MRDSLLVLFGWLALTALFVRQATTGFQTGRAPWQLFNFRDAPITRSKRPLAYWSLQAPTIANAIFFAVGSVVLILLLVGAFGPFE